MSKLTGILRATVHAGKKEEMLKACQVLSDFSVGSVPSFLEKWNMSNGCFFHICTWCLHFDLNTICSLELQNC